VLIYLSWTRGSVRERKLPVVVLDPALAYELVHEGGEMLNIEVNGVCKKTSVSPA